MKKHWKLLINQWKVKHNQVPWFVFFGLDGSGKTGSLKSLVAELEAIGLKVKSVHLPYDEYLVKTLLNQSMSRYSDRLVFALDNNIVGPKIEDWKRGHEYDIIVSQRCWIDSFVHGAVQGFDYDFIAQLNQVDSLPQCDAVVHLYADAGVAYGRIKCDPEGDKFEYPAYMKKQEQETVRAYEEIVKGNPRISPYFSNASDILINTSEMSEVETFEKCKDFFYNMLKEDLRR